MSVLFTAIFVSRFFFRAFLFPCHIFPTVFLTRHFCFPAFFSLLFSFPSFFLSSFFFSRLFVSPVFFSRLFCPHLFSRQLIYYLAFFSLFLSPAVSLNFTLLAYIFARHFFRQVSSPVCASLLYSELAPSFTICFSFDLPYTIYF
jgi:hypothetical protein